MITVHHIPVCPFSQRLEVLLALKGEAAAAAVRFEVVDITRPRPPELLALTRGATALPVLALPDGTVLRESLVLMHYLDTVLPGPRVAATDARRHAIEMLVSMAEREFANQGYACVMNTDRAQRERHLASVLDQFARLDGLLRQYGEGDGPWLFDAFGWVEAVFTPLFQRFWFLDYYEGFELPDEARFARVRRWREACLAHPAAQQVGREEIVKLYADYALGAGNGALLPGRRRSSFVFEPDWRQRPWPPRDKYALPAPSDEALGLLA